MDRLKVIQELHKCGNQQATLTTINFITVIVTIPESITVTVSSDALTISTRPPVPRAAGPIFTF